MTPVELLIHARWVLPIAPQNQILENHSIAIDQGRIQAVLPTAKAKEKFKAQETLSLDNHVIMPGLINAHSHAPMVLFRGLADDLALMDWLTQHIWPAESDIINAQSVEDGCRLAIAEMIRGGTTCFNEHYFYGDVLANTAISEGMRACIGPLVMSVPTGFAKNENEYLAKAERIYQEQPQHDLITWSLAPHAPYTTNDQTLLKVKALSESHNFIIHMHLHETEDEIHTDLKNHGKRPMQRLLELGLLDEKFVAVHMVHLTDEEIAMAKETGIHVVHCPESNMKLASGLARIDDLQKAGVNVAIGTDSACSNNDLDMFGEIRSATFMAKVKQRDPTTLPALQALKMATLNGAKALGIDREVGSLEVGKAADVIAINLDPFFTQPIYNPASQLVYAANRLQVSDVWIAGKRLLTSGKFTQLDIDRAVAKAKSWAKRCEKYKSAGSKMAMI